MPLRVLHLIGSAADDFYADLSRLYAADCLSATADPARYEFDIAYVSPDLSWRFPADLSDEALAAAPPMRVADAVSRIASLDIDAAIPQMFCRPGMTSYRALLDVLGIPYVGNPAEVMALGADKAKTKAVVAAAGVPVPFGLVCHAGERPDMSPPVVVKPVDADNSLGISLVRSATEYNAAITLALRHSEAAIVETYVELGREVRCGVVVRGGELHCLPLEEYNVDAVARPIRGYADKLRVDAGELSLVAKEAGKAWIVDVADPITERVWALAKKCHVALGCRDYSLFDFRIDPDGQPWFLEAGLYCSFAEKSVIAVMASADGLPLREFFGEAVSRAAQRSSAPD